MVSYLCRYHQMSCIRSTSNDRSLLWSRNDAGSLKRHSKMVNKRIICNGSLSASSWICDHRKPDLKTKIRSILLCRILLDSVYKDRNNSSIISRSILNILISDIHSKRLYSQC